MAEKRKTSRLWIRGSKGLDTNLIVITMFLIVFGLIMVYSASYYKASMSSAWDYDSMHFLKNQALMSVIGLIFMYMVSCINYHFWKKKQIVGLAVLLSIGLTLILLIPALSITANGATRWVKFGSISFQVAEPVKIAVIVATAWLIDKYGAQEIKWKKFTLRHWMVTAAIMIPGVGLAGFLGIISSNMSSALIIALIGVVMYFAWHPKSAVFYIAVIAAIALIGVLIYVISQQTVVDAESGFRLKRIRAWLDPYSYESDTSYQSLQALYAIGSGGLFGKGLGNSIQKLGSIPEPYNDFIFAIVCEELGVMGASLLILMFIYLLYRIFIIAQRAEDLFGRMLATGVFSHIALQVVLNIAVVTGAMPNTGVTLPFISYGGTATIFLLVEIGMVLNVQKWGERKREEDIRLEQFR
ncbi:MAG: putative peptidoglycan glycosyltransferase FtsW [Lachnospiraceae bacterium]|nr:putative peptidoglycan glycosyltransferase FtsW [Lachnospiraceae bacterium]